MLSPNLENILFSRRHAQTDADGRGHFPLPTWQMKNYRALWANSFFILTGFTGFSGYFLIFHFPDESKKI
jgi:hypothetical protein